MCAYLQEYAFLEIFIFFPHFQLHKAMDGKVITFSFHFLIFPAKHPNEKKIYIFYFSTSLLQFSIFPSFFPPYQLKPIRCNQ